MNTDGTAPPPDHGNSKRTAVLAVMVAVFALLLYLVFSKNDVSIKGEENQQTVSAKGAKSPLESTIASGGGGGGPSGISGGGSQTNLASNPAFRNNPTNPEIIFLPPITPGNPGNGSGSAKSGNGTGVAGTGPPGVTNAPPVANPPGPKIPRKPAMANRGHAGRRIAIANGASPATFDAIELGLAWLARVQEPDGRWNARKWGGGNHDLGCTGLAVLAFLGDGNSHLEGKYRENVRRALDWMASRQKQDGNLGWSTFYEQGIAATALCENCTLTQDRRYYNAAYKSIEHIIQKMGPDGGFGYSGPGGDTSVTGWQIMAYKSARLADIPVPAHVFNKCAVFLQKSVNPDGSTGYSYNKSPRNSMTAVGMFCRIFLNYPRNDPNLIKASGIIHRAGPNVSKEYYLYYGTYCMFQWGGEAWRAWNLKFRDPLIALQEKTGPNRGSWGKWGHGGGRVYATAINIMTLEVYQRFLPVYR